MAASIDSNSSGSAGMLTGRSDVTGGSSEKSGSCASVADGSSGSDASAGRSPGGVGFEISWRRDSISDQLIFGSAFAVNKTRPNILTPLCRRRAGVIAPENQFTTRTRRPLAIFVGRAANITAHVLLKRPTVKRPRLPLPCPFDAVVPQTTHVAIPCFKVLVSLLERFGRHAPVVIVRELGWQRSLNLI
jgi:hypothetical protein